jgi:GT2 family glycosyltransferase
MVLVDLSIIIVNYSSADYVMACVRSIHEQTPTLNYEVVVVDNASYDDCRERLSRDFPEVIYVQSPFNQGFGRANNLGAKHCSGAVLLFLNPDTEIRDGSIERLYRNFLKLDKPGAVGCRLLNSDGSLQTSCVQSMPTVLNQLLDADALQRLSPKSSLWGAAALFNKESAPSIVEAVSGACLMIRKAAFDNVGGFSPEYFMYGEDLDLCFKVRRAGLHNYHVRDALIVHHGGGSTNRLVSNFSNVMMRESVYRFFLKSRGWLYATSYRVGMCGAALIRMILLLALFPVLIRRSEGGWRATFSKWFRILRWGLGFERWILKFDHEAKVLCLALLLVYWETIQRVFLE